MRRGSKAAGRGVAVGVAAALLAAAVSAVSAGSPAAMAAAGEHLGFTGSAGSTAAPDPDDAGILALPADAVYRLSPQLAAMLGRDTIDAAGLRAMRAAMPGAARPGLPGEPTPAVGTTLLWPALDSVHGGPVGVYLKPYTLRAVGRKIEVWVASGTDGVSVGTAFPAGDCRNNTAHSTEVTDTQIKYLISQFDDLMYPKETKAFSTPPDRAGNLTVPGVAAAGLDFAGQGDHTVTLIDNVRDENFYEFPKNRSYIAGFFAPVFNEITDRNVMTIDAFDWIHRTKADPPNEPNKDLCKSRPARPFTYESVFGHEWQHLLQAYQDSDEVSWVNEGLSMFAESIDGYTDTTRNVHQTNSQTDLFCFNGFGTIKGPTNPNPTPCGGPQNSLTMWGDEGQGSEILADYGNAWSFMLFLYDRYGLGFMSALHRDGKAQGLAGLQAQLDRFANGAKAADVLHDYQLMVLLDRAVDVPGGTVAGISRSRVTTKNLDSAVNLANPTAHVAPGAAPNGADYIQLKLGGKPLRSVSFTGDHTVIAAAAQGPEIPFVVGQEPPGAVANWHVSLVGLDAAHHRALVKSKDGFTASFAAKDLAAFSGYPTVVAVVSHDDPTDLDPATEAYAGYSLTVNGKEVGV